jgi:hypothetical protein
LTILADGKFHQSVLEGTAGAVIREFKDKEDVVHLKPELVFDEVSGMITNISFKDGEFGTNLQIEIDGDGEISVGTSGNFGEDLMKKLPALNFGLPVIMKPYSFEVDGKSRKGVSVYQNGIKIDSFYWDKDKKVSLNGIPEVEGDTSKFKSDDWKMHFMKVRKFLVKKIEDMPAISERTATVKPSIKDYKPEFMKDSKGIKEARVSTSVDYPENDLEGLDQF